VKIGFLGAGAMGIGMLSTLVGKGHEVGVFDLSATAMDAAAALGARRKQSAADAAQGAEAIVSMLPTAESVAALYAELAPSLKPGQVCIDMSTIDPGTAIRIGGRLAEAKVDFLDCPVSGGVLKAREGALTIMVGGNAGVLERVRPALACMGSAIVHVGPIGTGAAAKLANNIIAAASMVATSEAFRLGTAYGVDPQVLTRILETSSGNTWVLHHMHPVPGVRPDSPSSKGYTPGFATDLMIEMLDIVGTAAFEKRIPLTLVPAMQQLWQLASNHGLARQDCTSVYQFIDPSIRKE